MSAQMHSTTIICVRKDGKVAIAGDGQVTLGRHGHQARREENPAAVQRQDSRGFAGSRRTALRCFRASNPSSSSFTATSAALPSNWPRTGGRTVRCAIWKP